MNTDHVSSAENAVPDADHFARLVTSGLAEIGASGLNHLVPALATFCAMVRRFRRAAGLTAEKVDRTMALRMAVEPLLALDFLPHTPQTVLDVGSGAGSPGIPFAVARPDLPLVMLEPDRRKSVFIGEVLRTLALEQASVRRLTLEELIRQASDGTEPTVLVSRAAMKPGKLSKLVGRKMPWVERMILFLGQWGVREVEREGYFVAGGSRSVAWTRAGIVAEFRRKG